MSTLGEGVKKLLLAGIGTVAVTAEKGKEILDELVKKGELTVEEGKILNRELKEGEVDDFLNTMQEKTDAFAETVKSRVGDFVENVNATVESAKKTAKEAAEDESAAVEDAADKAGETVSEAVKIIIESPEDSASEEREA